MLDFLRDHPESQRFRFQRCFALSSSIAAPKVVTSLAGTRRAMNEMYTQWSGLAPDDSPLILKSADLQQIYLLSLGGS